MLSSVIFRAAETYTFKKREAPVRIIVNGIMGRMGKCLAGLVSSSGAHVLVCGADPRAEPGASGAVSKLSDYRGEADCIIDFSDHRAARQLCDYAVKRGIPLVVATTGHTPAEKEIIRAAAEKIPVFFSANMSLGAALTARLVRTAASFFPDADIEIVETHHSGKTDAPSGTALMLADEIKRVRTDAFVTVGRRAGARKKNEIGVHSVRIGNVTGRHEVMISTGSETLRIVHEAHDCLLFAEGALAAAEYVVRRLPGLYTMRNIANED